jgi:flagellar hook-length control protein FliK
MQASILPIQISGAGAAPARPANGSSDGAQFSQTLSREMAQRQNTAPAPAPAPNRNQPKPAAADRPAQANAQRAPEKTADKNAERVAGKDAERADEAQASAEAEGTETTASASANADSAAPARKGEATDSASDSASAAAAAAQDAGVLGPMAEMLALVAGFNQPVAAPAASAATAAASGGLTGIAADAAGATAQRGAVIDTSALPAAAAAVADAASTQAGASAVPVATDMAKLIAQASAAAGAPAGAAADAATDGSRAAASVASGAIPAELAMAQARLRVQAEGASMPRSPTVASDAQASALVQDSAAGTAAETPASSQDATQLGDLAAGPGAAQPATTAADSKGAAAIQQPQALPVADAGRRAEFRAPEPVQANVDLQVHSASAQPLSGPVQQLSAGLAQTMASSAADHIPARVGTTAWENQVGQKIVWMVAGEEQSASLTLNPPDLGPMQVVLSVTNDQASVAFTAAQPEVRQALEDALPKLREMMGESGISLGSASVNAGSPQQQAFAGADGGQGSREGGTRGQPGRSGNAEGTPAANGRPVRPGGNGLVDTFA